MIVQILAPTTPSLLRVSDQEVVSLSHILHTISKQVIGIIKNIKKDILFYFDTKFSELTL